MYDFGDRELKNLKELFASKQLFRYQSDNKGFCNKFEAEISSLLKIEHSLLVTSGTNALFAALKAAEIGPGDEVIIPSYTFAATAVAVTLVEAKPVVVDIDETLTLCPDSFRSAITSRTKAVIPVHIDGLASDMEKITTIAKKYNLCVIEDACQAFGGTYKGRHLGSIGDFGCFSFNQEKIITSGEGGLVAAKTLVHYEKLFCMMDATGPLNPVNKELLRAENHTIGGSMRVSEITGAILCAQLTRLNEILQRLCERKAIFVDKLSGSNQFKVILGADADGDCGTTLHLTFDDPTGAILAGKKMRSVGLVVFPPAMQPGRVCWKWGTPYPYKMANYLRTSDILMRTLKIQIDIDLTLEETEEVANKILSCI